MATVINNPGNTAPAESSGGGMGMIIGAVILLLAVFLFIYYGLPAIRSASAPATTSVTVPDQIDVNVQTPQGQ